MNQNQLCWIKINDLWEKSEIIGKKNNTLLVNYNGKTYEKDIFTDDILFRNSDKEDNCNNLIELIHLNEPSILNNVNLRYDEDNIYTFNGDILIAINPFKNLNIYSNDIINQYNNYSYDRLLPHPFYIGKKTLENIKNNENQTILVSGESGAGKTQTTKFLMNYITNISDKVIENLENKILASNPILEAFGNAKTIRNDNSSRFGKFIKLLFNENILCGAEIKTYLLEKIRITKLSENERNFHIFYMLVKSLPVDLKTKYFLQNVENYNYLNCSKVYSRTDGIKDEIMFDELQYSFKTLNFNEFEIDNIYKIISAILQLGNIDDVSDLENNDHLDKYCQLMDFPKNDIVNIFKFRYIEVNNEKIEIDNKQEDFIVIRDTLSQLIYCLLFEYIVDKINKSIKSDYSNFIGILDIFGFEVFENNGFEQLSINYTNEKLQSIFNKFIFQLEQEEYVKEKIEWKDINYPDNLEIVNLFENKKGGIFSLLQEQCILKSGNDKNFYNLLVKNLNEKSNFNVSPRDKSYQRFDIDHYAGKVQYTVENFIYKNRNQIEERFQNLIKNGSEFVSNFNLDIFSQDTKNLKTKSLIYQFRNSLNELLKIISSTRQHYIRCIKPNDNNIANNFDRLRVLEQLKYCGVLEAIKIARAGYPIRIKKQMFIDHFYTFMNNSKLNLHTDNIANFIETTSEVKKNDYQLGTTKVFLKKHIYDELILRNRVLVNSKSIVIQKNMLSWYYNLRWKKFLKVKKLVKFYRLYYQKKQNSVTKISSNYKSYSFRKKFLELKKKVIIVQSIFRMKRDTKKCNEIKNIIKIQSLIRYKIIAKKFKSQIMYYRASKKIQKFYRVYQNRQIILNNLKKMLDMNNRCMLLEKLLEEERREKEALKNKESKLDLNDNFINHSNSGIIEEQKQLINEQQEILGKKNDLIAKLIDENSKLKVSQNKNTVNQEDHTLVNDINSETTEIYINYEIANKMENLYLQLSQAKEELSKMKKNKSRKNRGFMDIVKGWFN